MSSPGLVVVSIVNNTIKGNIFGVHGFSALFNCSGTSLIAAEKAWVYKLENPDNRLGETNATVWDAEEMENNVSIEISALTPEDEGYYHCAMELLGRAVLSQQLNFLKILHIEIQPPRYFSGPRRGSASVDCSISFPEVIPIFEIPNLIWKEVIHQYENGSYVTGAIDGCKLSINSNNYFMPASYPN